MTFEIFSVFVLLAGLITVGTPIAFSMAISGAIGLWLVLGPMAVLGVLQNTSYRSTASFLLVTVPMFMLMAEFMSRSGIATGIFQAANAFLRKVKGGLAIGTVVANAVMAAISGSSTATTAAMASVALPEMRRHGYDDRLSLGVISVSGTLAIMIPPSIPLILYGVITETSIGKLLIAGILPGLLTAVGYCVAIWLMVWLRPEIAPTPKDEPSTPTVRPVRQVIGAWDGLLLAGIVLGGIYSGAITPTEASAIGALGAFLIAVFYRRIGIKGLTGAIDSATRICGVIFLIVIGAMIFSYFLSASQVSRNLVLWVEQIDQPVMILFCILLVVYICLGFFMDQLAILFLTLPLFFPLVMSWEMDPIWFGIIVTKTVEIGLITPPLGMNAYVAASATGAPIEKVFRAIFPFFIVDVVILIILVAFPQISLWLPGMM
ncbi:TRAP transporter large permease [Futiania mangrovi]|uniref:TRAP transporter large permease protein n=1 Tax=Futiania mangrovi TaxID=2959716 RepID=A0A9J6P9E7_9PROT|nr:TRAP transporter large permease [Futiania mangrovii]MCP1335469.1 TRAP transporter large permease [Futiania mangrovii]